ncbi:MULE domain-containing protein, partial [Aphis craccivora]
NWFTDGTFERFNYIHILDINKYLLIEYFIPIFALLLDKNTVTYSCLIKTLRSQIPLNPKTIMTDFEQSAILAFKENIPNFS